MKFRFVWVGAEEDPEGYRVAQGKAALRPPRFPRYEIRGTEMVRCELKAGQEKLVPIANFSARIVSDFVFEDGAETRRVYGIEAKVRGHDIAVQLPAAEFGRMGWVLNKLGPEAIIYPGQQQHARAAIQHLSRGVREQKIFTHTGWRRVRSDWIYLQSGPGKQGECDVRLPSPLEHFELPHVSAGAELVSAIRASLRFLSVAPDRVSCPLLAAVYRAPFGNVDFSLFMTGPSGSFKTALAALCQQHFGAEMDAMHLPAHFGCTGNALEELAFTAKDALLVVDDFVATVEAGGREVQGVAERLFRAAGNHQGRGRLGGYGLVRSPRPPRALVLATGEQVPRGRSLRARLLIVELWPKEVEVSILTGCQTAAAQGQFAAAMAGFVRWIAARYEDMQQRLRMRVRELRSQPLASAGHARLSTTLAELQSGWDIWLEFALEAGAIGVEEQLELSRRSCRALLDVGLLQMPYQLDEVSGMRLLGSEPGDRKIGCILPPGEVMDVPVERTAEQRGDPPRSGTKKAKVIAMLKNEGGATLAELTTATGWQNHTVRGFLSGTITRRMRLAVSSFQRNGDRVYRIENPPRT